MIYGALETAYKYDLNDPKFKTAFAFLARKDLAENNRFWEQFEGAAAETHEKINDAYLRANGQQEGVKSYGRMVDLMLAWARVHPFS